MAPLLRFCTAFLGVIASSSAELDADEPGVSMLQADSRGVRRSASNPLLVAALTDGMLDYLADSDAPYTAEEVGHIAANMAANFFPNGTLVAAPSKVSSNHSNDYFFMWQRDAALTMRTLLRITVAAPGGKFAAIIGDVGSPIRQQLVRYAELLPKLWNQADPNTMCPPWYKDQPGWCPPLGEPKYFVNGSVYDQPWGRPQNDGPALAAVYLSDLLNAILDDGGNSTGDFTAQLLRGGGTEGILYDALDFVNTWYNEGSVGPWEEIYGNHFFVAEVQRKALLEGARVAKRMGQDGDAQWPKSGYKNWVYSAGNLRGASESFFSEETLVVKATVGRQQGLAGPKCLSSERVLLETGEVWPTMVEFPCELDVNTVIAANFVFNSKAAGDSVMPPYDARLLRTTKKLIQSMAPNYQVNAVDRAKGLAGLLVGRYPGDTYCGYGECGKEDYGNPWFLTTHALAEQMYWSAWAICSGMDVAGHVQPLMDELRKESRMGSRVSPMELGDAIMKNAKAHAIMPGVHMSEQIKMRGPDVGKQAGVPDLTWSYASALDALLARHEATTACRRSLPWR